MNWGNWIVVSFLLFAVFIAVLVTVCVRQDISLVSPDYYQEELVFQDQIERERNTELLAQRPSIKMRDQRTIQIDFPQFNEIESGELILFRPSDPALDKKFRIEKTNQSSQQYVVHALQSGMYRARMVWTMAGKEFYFEEIIHI